MLPGYLPFLAPQADREAIVAEHRRRRQWAEQDKKGFLRYRQPAARLAGYRAGHVDCQGPEVVIGRAEELDEHQRREVEDDLRRFMPWRKGPFSVFGTAIDAEWQSDRKWQRLAAALPDLEGKIIADVGCNNGYYMFRMTAAKPKLVLGFEPTIQHFYCFSALNAMAGRDELHIDLLGVEHLPWFSLSFDVIFLLGIIYHRPSPVQTLRDILGALRPGGTAIVESQAIPGDDPVALFPADTYAKVPGTWFVPTGPCLVNWMRKAGFAEVELFCSHPMSAEEQRRTPWMTFESYSDFLHPHDPGRTCEGYPAPWRVFVRGRKKG